MVKCPFAAYLFFLLYPSFFLVLFSPTTSCVCLVVCSLILCFLRILHSFEKRVCFVLTESLFCGTIYPARQTGSDRTKNSDAKPIGKNVQFPPCVLCRTAKKRKNTKCMEKSLTENTKCGIIGSVETQDTALPVFMFRQKHKIWDSHPTE